MLRQALKRELEQKLHDMLTDCTPQAQLLSLSLPINDLEVLEWLAAQTEFPKVYWQGRGEGRSFAGVGAAVVLGGAQHSTTVWTDLDTFTSTHPHATLFGGLRFDSQRTAAPEWRDFGGGVFFLPAFLIEQDDDTTLLHCHIMTEDHATRDEHMSAFTAELDRLVFDLPASSQRQRPEVEKISSDEPDQTRFVQSVEALTETIARGDLEKVVLARRMDVTFSGPVDPFRFVHHFKFMKSPAYFFCFQFSPETAFVGSSPERLYRRSGRTMSSEALAGTRRRGSTPSEDAKLEASLLATPKDHHEHQLVHNHICAALAPLCGELTAEEEPTVLKLILVQHLLSHMSGTLKEGLNDTRVLRALHPTPAVGGLPVQPALQLIREHEPFDRGWYAAPVGRISHDEADLSVAIRSGLLHGNTLSLYCGAGIVTDSEPLAEWDEIESKFANFLHVIHAE